MVFVTNAPSGTEMAYFDVPIGAAFALTYHNCLTTNAARLACIIAWTDPDVICAKDVY